MHFFSHWDGSEKDKEQYLAHFPWCQTKSRLVTADLTPSQYIPKAMADFYGPLKERVTFVMLLRHPAKNLQSFYYYEHQDKYKLFKDFVSNMIGTGDGGRYLGNVQYTYALTAFCKYFDASQLIVAPMKYNEGAKDGMPRLTEFVWDRLGLLHAPTNDPPVDSWNRNDGRPSIEEDLDESMLHQLDEFLHDSAGSKSVATVLAAAASQSRARPFLYGYKGAPEDVFGIDAWLVDGW